ncbi:MAG TPA: APC family permease [Rhizomicrobium sp.]|jgi:amino acid transporter
MTVEPAAQEDTRGLKRSMRVVGALLLTLSSVTPASSVFVIVPGVIQQAGTGAFLSMLAGGLLAFPIAFVYAELSSAFPIAGGEYCMTGRTLGPGWGFAMLGLILASNMLAPAVFALGAGDYIATLLPGVSATSVALVILVGTTVLSLLHIRTNAWVTGIFLLLEILALIVLAALGFLNVQHPLSELAFHPVMVVGGNIVPASFAAIGLATALSIFAYNGYGTAVYFAEEMHEAPRLIGRTIIWAVVITVLSEFIPVVAVLAGAPDIKTLVNAQNPFSMFVLLRGGRLLQQVISLSIAIAIVNAVLATLLQNARFFYSTGRDGTWHRHINDGFLRTHARFHSPWIATLVAGASSILFCFLGMNLLLVLTGTQLVLVYAGLCAASLEGRRGGSTAHATFRMRFFPLLPIVGLVSCAYILYANWLDKDVGRPSLIANAVIIMLSLAYYYYFLHVRGGWVLKDPEPDAHE